MKTEIVITLLILLNKNYIYFQIQYNNNKYIINLLKKDVKLWMKNMLLSYLRNIR